MLPFSIMAQSNYYKPENKAALKKLNHLVGTWEGEGWVMNKDTYQKETFKQKEDIYYRLDSTLIEVHGYGESDGQVVHDALALIANNPEGSYTMSSFVGDGRTGNFDMLIEGENLVWTIPTEQGTIRYTILVKDGTWTEKGDFGRDNTWYPFFEMKLKKLESTAK